MEGSHNNNNNNNNQGNNSSQSSIPRRNSQSDNNYNQRDRSGSQSRENFQYIPRGRDSRDGSASSSPAMSSSTERQSPRYVARASSSSQSPGSSRQSMTSPSTSRTQSASSPSSSPLSLSMIPQSSFPCMICDTKENTSEKILEHLFSAHKVTIAKVECIADLPRYLQYYKEKLVNNTLESFGKKKGESLEVGRDEDEEDKKLREKLQASRLRAVIEKKEGERRDLNFKRKCLFCKKVFEGDLRQLFHHMFSVHKFNVGLPDNLVNINELLDILQNKINNLQCIYCEKIFKSYSVLKLHMRKKKHFKIDSRNTEFDRFYLVNYLESGKDWKQIESEPDDDDDDDDTDSEGEKWGDWVEEDEEDGDEVRCLFCPVSVPSSTDAFRHAKLLHNFDFYAIRKEFDLNFYDSIKLLNFIRAQMKEKKCLSCGETKENEEELVKHMQTDNHMKITNRDAFTDPKYLFPTVENDAILRGFDDEVWSDDGDGGEDDDNKIDDDEDEELDGEEDRENEKELLEKLAKFKMGFLQNASKEDDDTKSDENQNEKAESSQSTSLNSTGK